MDFLTIIGTFFLCYLLYYFYGFWKIRNKFDRYGIPYERGWPFVGNMEKPILKTKSFFETLCASYKLFSKAKYIAFFDFKQPAIVIQDPDLIKSIAIKNSESFSDHRGFANEKLDPLFGKNLFSLKGQKWHDVRTLLSPAFTSSKMKMMFEVMLNSSEDFVNCICEMATKDGKDFEMKDTFTRFGNDVIATCAFGLKIDSMRNPENEFYVLGRKATNFDGILSLKFFLLRNFPWLTTLFKIKLFNDHLMNFFMDIVKNTIKTRDEQGISRPDMLQLMMETRGKPNELTLLDMTCQAFIFFFGGFDTTTTQMSFLAHEIAVNPEVHRRLQEEIDSVWYETKGNLTYDAVNGMPYLDALINECLRLYPTALFADRVCGKDFELPPTLPGSKPYTLQPGDCVWFPIGPMLHDPKYFPDPEKFVPERFMDKKMPQNQPPFIPFGLGPRICIGNRFALLEVKIVITQLLLRCNLKACPRTNVPMVYSKTSFPLLSKGGFWLRIEPRHPSPVDKI